MRACEPPTMHNPGIRILGGGENLKFTCAHPSPRVLKDRRPHGQVRCGIRRDAQIIEAASTFATPLHSSGRRQVCHVSGFGVCDASHSHPERACFWRRCWNENAPLEHGFLHAFVHTLTVIINVGKFQVDSKHLQRVHTPATSRVNRANRIASCASAAAIRMDLLAATGIRLCPISPMTRLGPDARARYTARGLSGTGTTTSSSFFAR